MKILLIKVSGMSWDANASVIPMHMLSSEGICVPPGWSAIQCHGRGFFPFFEMRFLLILFFVMLTSYISVQFSSQAGAEIQSPSAFKNLRWHFSKHRVKDSAVVCVIASLV